MQELEKRRKLLTSWKRICLKFLFTFVIFHKWIIRKFYYVSKKIFNERCIEFDFSEIVTIKSKFKHVDAHFSSKVFALHCAIYQPWTAEIHVLT